MCGYRLIVLQLETAKLHLRALQITVLHTAH
jgi:hypothetical protein